MELLTAELRLALPGLYAQDGVQDPTVHVKFFTPDARWTWFVTEGNAIDGDGEVLPDAAATAADFRFFGYVVGHAEEWGYFLLSELEAGRGPRRLAIERDLHFRPRPFSQVRADEGPG